MSPGCFTIEQQQQQSNDFNNCDMLILNETSYDLDNLTTAKYETNSACAASEILKTNSNYKHSFIFTSYHHEINLDTIPLPSTPYPFKEEEEENEDDEEDNTSQSSTNSSASSCDTIDSFEILEQTIMKQKRLGRCKNVDLRRKVLLKRTFDLVCQIMDHENGFEEEENDATPTTNTSISAPKIDNNLLVVNAPKESLDTLPHLLVSPVYLDDNNSNNNSNSTSNSMHHHQQQNDQILRTILNNNNEESNSNFTNSYYNFNTSSPSSSSLAQLTNIESSTSSLPSLKRKQMSFVTSTSSNKKLKLQRRPSNSDDDDYDETEYECDENDDSYDNDQNNFICLFDDDNDPFGIGDVVNLTSF